MNEVTCLFEYNNASDTDEHTIDKATFFKSEASMKKKESIDQDMKLNLRKGTQKSQKKKNNI